MSISQAREELGAQGGAVQSAGSGTCSSGDGLWEQMWGATQTWKLSGCSSSHSTSETDQGPFLSAAFSLSCCREGQAALGWQWCLCGGQRSSWGWDGMERKDCESQVQSPRSGQRLLQQLSSPWSRGDVSVPPSCTGAMLGTSLCLKHSDHTWLPGMADRG